MGRLFDTVIYDEGELSALKAAYNHAACALGIDTSSCDEKCSALASAIMNVAKQSPLEIHQIADQAMLAVREKEARQELVIELFGMRLDDGDRFAKMH